MQITDVDILNFALNLEYLEATWYHYVTYGRDIPAELTGGGPAPQGGRKGALTEEGLEYAIEITTDELNHVRFLRTALGELPACGL